MFNKFEVFIINKQKIETLIETGQMTEAGLQCVDIAKQNGSWTILDAIEDRQPEPLRSGPGR